MSLSPRVKLALKVLVSAYVVLVLGFIVKSLCHDPSPDREQIVQELAAVAKKHDIVLIERDAKEMYDRFLAKKGDVFGLNYTALMQILNFTILMLLLYGFGWQPMIEFLDKRRGEIRGEIESARQNNAEAKELLAQYEQKVQDARQERQELVEDGRREGQQERQAIIEQAQQQAQRILKAGQQQLAAEVDRARDELRSQISGISVQVARSVLEREIQPDDHQSMIDGLVKEIESADLSV